MNALYYGDNLDILRRYVKDESVDLIYLDPPFKSNQDYNVLFAEQDGSRSAAQIKAFEDTWRWDSAAASAYQETVEQGGKPSEALQGFRRISRRHGHARLFIDHGPSSIRIAARPETDRLHLPAL